ncbi:MAG: alpha-amylase family glycosyl hydrolase [Calditrichaceae bacterium]
MRKILYILTLLVTVSPVFGEIITSTPAYPMATDSIVVIYNAAEGNLGLKDYTGDVYAHTGLITELSTSPSDWLYVKTNWGENTSETKMTPLGNNLWKLTIGHIDQYYGVNLAQEKVLQLAFVFRSASSPYKEGKDVGNADIFLDLYDKGITVQMLEPGVSVIYGLPERSPVFLEENESLQINATAATIETQLAELRLYSNGSLMDSTPDDTLKCPIQGNQLATGMNYLSVVAVDTSGIIDSLAFSVMLNPPVAEAIRPAGIKEGINYIDDNTVSLSIFAPYKQFIYVVGDFNDWKVDEAYMMNRETVDNDSVYYWLTLDGLTPDQEYAFQYLVDGEIRIADPYTDKVLDPWNDGYITDETYPDLKAYPAGKTSEIVSVLQTGQSEYSWQVNDFQRPAPEGLIIYELLLRDFLGTHNYKTLTDTLDYLQRLGVSAVELMPVSEFENNESWGYNPSFYFAPDKYYGTKDDFKRFIDECHSRGIAVIMDMVLNHSYGQSPFVRLYNEGNYGQPTPENPWYNVTSPNTTYSWGYDFNHESPATKKLVDRINRYWLTEYNIDGFRFDFTKGFTNKSGDGWYYDASRINILKRMADQIWLAKSDAYVILEHFAENSEEKELSNYGMMIWGNSNYNYNEATMGWNSNSDFKWGYYEERGWTNPTLVTYMESHDEERLMYKNLAYGNSYGDYNIQELSTALNRIKLAAAFFITLPGPKMIWQFGELGYDYSIDFNGRVGNKPIRWDYCQDQDRANLYKTYAALIKLRKENEVFTSANTSASYLLSGAGKRINLTHSTMNATIIGNFGVAPLTVTPSFQTTGIWYDYFSGDSIDVLSTSAGISLQPGEFRIYTTNKIETPEQGIISAITDDTPVYPVSFSLEQNYPNPFNPATTIEYHIESASDVAIVIYDILGRRVQTLVNEKKNAGVYKVDWNGLDQAGNKVASGVYFYRLNAGDKSFVRKMVMIE